MVPGKLASELTAGYPNAGGTREGGPSVNLRPVPCGGRNTTDMEKKEKASGSHRPTAGKWNGAKVQTAGLFSQEKCFHHADHRVYFARAFPLLLADWDTLLTHKLENQTSVLLDIFVMEFVGR